MAWWRAGATVPENDLEGATVFSNVLVGVDGRQGGRDAIAFAKQLAAVDAQITLAHIYSNDWMLGRGAALALPGEREESERLLIAERDAAALEAELVSLTDSPAGRGLLRLAERRAADVLVVGSCHRGLLGRVFLGDQTTGALNGAPCAVAVAPLGYAASSGGIQTLGVGYDGSPESELALETARELAAHHGAAIKARAVVSLQSIPYGEPIPDNWPEVAKQLVDEELRRLRGLTDIEGDVTYGEPSEELAQFSEELDLLIVGSRSYGPVGRLFNGSTSNYLARRARCPLLVLPRSAAKDSRTSGAAGKTEESMATPA
jgi:nucleotide-binding universal stress UspA family protein